MPEFGFLIFAADNLSNPQNPGFLPAEDNTFLSDLVIGDRITWNGGGETAFVTVDDPTGTTFDEAQSNQTLVDPVTFNGIPYAAGQVVTPTYTIVFSGSDGNSYTMTSFNFSPNTNNEIPDAVFWEGSVPPAGTVLTVTSEINPTRANSRDFADFVTCFCAGTLIETSHGPKPVEHLTTKDSVVTKHGECSPVLNVFCREVTFSELSANPKLRPVVVSRGAFGQGLPTRELRVSRQHRFYVRSPICERMFGESEVLVSAVHLTQLPGVYFDNDITQVGYYHILLQNHQVIFAEGTPTESLYFGVNTVHALSDEALDEIAMIFPDLSKQVIPPEPACYIPLGRHQRRLVSRHLKNAKPLLI